MNIVTLSINEQIFFLFVIANEYTFRCTCESSYGDQFGLLLGETGPYRLRKKFEVPKHIGANTHLSYSLLYLNMCMYVKRRQTLSSSKYLKFYICFYSEFSCVRNANIYMEEKNGKHRPKYWYAIFILNFARI